MRSLPSASRLLGRRVSMVIVNREPEGGSAPSTPAAARVCVFILLIHSSCSMEQ